MDGLMNDAHWNTISNVYTLGQIRHIIYVQCPHTGIFVPFMGIIKKKKTHYNNSNKTYYWCFTLCIFVCDLNL